VTNSFSVVVREVNALPTLARATNATIDELAGYTQDLAPQDSDIPVQPLTLTLLSGPTGLVVTNGMMAWTPTEAQGPSTNEVVLTVSDGVGSVTNSFSVVVREVNALPTLARATNATIDELVGYTQDLAPQDSDIPVQPLAVTLLSGPTGLVVTNGVMAWTPTEAQGPSTNEVVVTVSDGVGSVTNSFSVVVGEVNLLPTLAGLTNATIDELVGYTQDLVPQDGDIPVQPLAVTLLSGPTGLVVTNGVMAWTPTEAQGPSTNEVVLTVSDGVGSVTNSFSVVVGEVNLLPTLAAATNSTINELVGYTQDLAPQDSDIPEQPLTVTLLSGPTGLAVTNGVMAWTPTEAQGPSTNEVVVTVSDGVGSVTNSFSVVVGEVNVLPTLAGATNATIDELVGYTQDLAPQDGDIPEQPLTVTLLSGPTGLVVTNGVLAWTPTEAQGPSTNEVVVAVSDGVGSVTNSLIVVVGEVNVLPTLAGATNATIDELVGYTQDLVPQDSDIPVQPLTVTLLSGPTGLVVTNGVMAWTPTEAQGPSTNEVVVTVGDGVGSVTNSFSVVVSEINVAPRWAVIPDGVGEVGREYVQRLEALDEDLPAQFLTFQLLEPIPGAVVESGLFRWTPTSPQAGTTNRIRVVASDGVASVESEFRIRVIGASTPPTFVGIPELAGDRLRLRVRMDGGLRLEVSDDLIDWRPHSTLEGPEGSVVTTEIPVELGFKFFRVVRNP
jgi:Ca2+/H+ antiporter